MLDALAALLGLGLVFFTWCFVVIIEVLTIIVSVLLLIVFMPFAIVIGTIDRLLKQ